MYITIKVQEYCMRVLLLIKVMTSPDVIPKVAAITYGTAVAYKNI